MDLDALAESYSHRPPTAAALARPVRAAVESGLTAGAVAVDIGGGPGSHAGMWSALGLHALVVDPTEAMCRMAASVDGVLALRGRGEALPLGDGVVDLAYLHNSLHYLEWPAALREIHRVLRPGGTLWIWTLGPDHHVDSALARWFPSVVEIDMARFPDPADVIGALPGLGFDPITAESDHEQVIRLVGEWSAAVEAGFISTLQLIDARELSRGMDTFAADHPDPDEELRYLVRFTLITASRPSLP